MAEKTRPTRRKRRQTKDRVLQARIPEQLDEELRGRADQLGLSVSTIVRNVLLHTFDLVEGVVTDSANIARTIQGRESPESTQPAPSSAEDSPAPEVIGWQEAVLNRNGICEQCNTILPMGERAAVGVPAGPRPVLLCLDCLTALSATSSPSTTSPSSAQSSSKNGETP